ncbi:dihydrofolate reductase family protein [Cytobacillus sp. FSL K6-0265]|uniref:dihydrofolate reductase family protein n=1 Tax=Cytobacillus sp. FSL K6-0265 TaxID=2921448 RepID=UPI0030FC43CC
MTRPHIVCQILATIDGRTKYDFLSLEDVYPVSKVFNSKFTEYKPDAFAAGRVSLDGSFASNDPIDLAPFYGKEINRNDFIANANAGLYLIAIDAKGKLKWKTNMTSADYGVSGNAHVVAVLSENVDNAYLAYLQSIGVSYIFAGAEGLNFTVAAEKLYKHFGIKKMIVEGGPMVNGSFAYEGLIDELSLIVAPIVDDSVEKSSLFEKSPSLTGNIPPMEFSFEKMEQVEQDIIWLNYKKKGVSYSSKD